MKVFIDGDFPTGKGCKYHCSPTCHPAQVGPEWLYGCAHKAWPQNRAGDFCPIVDCGGKIEKCQLSKSKMLKNYENGIKRRISNAKEKIEDYEKTLREIEFFNM